VEMAGNRHTCPAAVVCLHILLHGLRQHPIRQLLLTHHCCSNSKEAVSTLPVAVKLAAACKRTAGVPLRKGYPHSGHSQGWKLLIVLLVLRNNRHCWLLLALGCRQKLLQTHSKTGQPLLKAWLQHSRMPKQLPCCRAW